jgi:AraC-like DNA-binding protein
MNPNTSRERQTAAGVVATFVSRNIDVASERLTSIYGANTSVDYLGDKDAFSMSFAAAKVGCLILGKARIAGWCLTRPIEGLTHISIPVVGTPLKYRCGMHSYEVSAGEFAAVGRPFETIQLKMKKGAAIVLYAPIERLIDRAEQLTAGSLSGSPVSQMVDRLDLRAPVGEAFARTLKTALAEIGALNSAGLGSLVVSGYEDLLTNLAVAALFPSIAQDIGRSATQCGPATIRRARDFIKAHAAEHIKLSELAAELGLPMRTLQDNFRRFFGLSPREWLLECRLENARRGLTLPGRPTSVATVAYECGFGDLSGFSAKYLKKYGESPSQTLRISRQHFW